MDFLNIQLTNLRRALDFVSAAPVNWRLYVQACSWGVTLFESYLLLRQFPLYNKTEPPSALSAHFTPEVFKKSQDYGRDKAKFSLVSGLFTQIVDTTLLQVGFYPWSWKVAGLLLAKVGFGSEYEITQSLVFVAVIYFASTVYTLPMNVYQTFVLEQKHGFNKTTPTVFVMDIIKSWGLALVIGAPFLSAFLYVFKWAGDKFVPWLMGFMVIVQILLVFLVPTVIQPLFNKFTPLAPGELRDRVEALASKLHFPLKHLYEIDGSKRSSHSNAYFFGLPWSKHIVIYDTLIQESKPEEVEAVLAHELGHWYYLHSSKLLLANQLHIFAIIGSFPAFLHSPPLLRSFGFPEAVAARPPPMIAFLLFQSILMPLEAVVGIAMNALTRKFEWEADQFAVELQDTLKSEEMKDMGDRLARALISLHVANLSTVWVDWLYSAYHHSHPTLTERLKALEAFKAKRASIKNIDRKKEL